MSRAVGHVLRHLRKSKGLSLNDLVRETRIPYSTLHGYEDNPARLNPANPEHQQAVALLAKALSVKPDDIWNAKPVPPDELEEDLQNFLLATALDKSLPKTLRDEARALLARLLP